MLDPSVQVAYPPQLMALSESETSRRPLLWWGLAAGQWMLADRGHWLSGSLPRGLAPLAALGRWSLSFYMLHQPVLIGAVALFLALRR